jgi:PKHD-type hydroxylase
MITQHVGAGAFTPEECVAIRDMAAQGPLRAAALVGHVANASLRRAEIVWLDDLPGAGWVMDRLVRLTSAANRESFGFDLTDFGESAQCARYGAENSGHFDWHSDIGKGTQAARRKLTLVVQLSDPGEYAGGQLELRPDSHIRPGAAGQGDVTLFPSFVLHRVTPVTEGTRWSLTLWAHGPAFR